MYLCDSIGNFKLSSSFYRGHPSQEKEATFGEPTLELTLDSFINFKAPL